jgi:hypothetical protein
MGGRNSKHNPAETLRLVLRGHSADLKGMLLYVTPYFNKTSISSQKNIL